MNCAVIVTTADLMEVILRTPEPGATRLRSAWLRLREDDRLINAEGAGRPMEVPPTVIVAEQAKGIKALKHQLAVTAKARYSRASAAAVALGVSRYTFYRWLREAG